MAADPKKYEYVVLHRWPAPSGDGRRDYGDYTMTAFAETHRMVSADAGGPAVELLVGSDVVARADGQMIHWSRTEVQEAS